ncbi:MAG: S8 family serine peptidase, partial [bacterium]|nr:S8 family serine peptidase [bacterium]
MVKNKNTSKNQKTSKSSRGLYTYRAGKKVPLEKSTDQFVVRELPTTLAAEGFPEPWQVSSASSRVTVDSNKLENMITKARNMFCAHHAYTDTAGGNEFLITDRIIVTFRDAPGVEAVGIFAGKYALEIVKKYSDRKFLFRLSNATGMNPVKLVVLLMEKETAMVENAEHDLNVQYTLYLELPRDPEYPKQWHLHTRRTHREYDHRSCSRCEEAWQILDGYGDDDVVVAVSDDGCRIDHTDFDSEGKFDGWGYFKGTTLHRMGEAGADPDEMYDSGANHGTSCAGVIAAEVDGLMTTGAAAACRLLPIKWESEGPRVFISDDKMLTLLDYIEDRVDVFSNSWGSTPTSSWSSDVTDRITELALNGGRRGKGIVFLWAAGNENCPISHDTTTPVPVTHGWEQDRFGQWRWVGVRTATHFSHDLVGIPGVMHIAALASTAQRSHYSNYGTGIDICAPTSNSHRFSRL